MVTLFSINFKYKVDLWWGLSVKVLKVKVK